MKVTEAYLDMRQVEISGGEIPVFLARLDALTRAGEYADFRPYFIQCVRDTAKTFGVTEQDILDTLDTRPGVSLA